MNDISLVGNAIQITRDNNSPKGYVNVPIEYDAFEEHGNTYVSLLIGKDNFTWKITELTIGGDTIDDLADALTKLSAIFPNANSGNGGSGAQAIYSISATLGDEDIKALPGTDFELLPSPGPGKIFVPQMAYLFAQFTEAYGGIDAPENYPAIWIATKYNNLQLQEFIDEPDTPSSDLTILLTSTIPGLYRLGTYDVIKRSGVASSIWGQVVTNKDPFDGGENTSLKIGADNSINFTGGHVDNTLKVTVFYSIYNL